MKSDSRFNVTCLATVCKLYPDNTVGAFTIQLAQPIELNSKWEVRFCEFTCPPAGGSCGGGDKKHTDLIYCNLISPQLVGGSLAR
jgi:hypothetical protein